MFDGGGGGSTNTTQTTTVELSPEQRELFNLALPAITEFAGNPPVPFPGATVAGLNPAQQVAQQTLVNTAQGDLTNLGQSALQASQFFLGPGLDPNTNPFLQSAIAGAVRPISENFTQNILPNIRGEAVTSGQLGGSRQGIAEGIASQGVSRAIGDTAAGVASQGYQAALDAGIRALGLAPGTGGLLTAPGTVISAVGSERQIQEQRQIDADISRFSQEQLLPYLSAREITSLAFGIPNQTAISTGTTSGGGVSPIQGALGGAATGAIIGSLVPGLGTGLGAAFGGLLGLLG